ncbi:MAG: hypothetical protein OEL87_01815 [Nanoarchaeota archaeon]|nr:hypothetical protein [Nanoarchaeota archaeon]
MVKKVVVKEEVIEKGKVSNAFVDILAVISILGFLSIISYTLFDTNIEKYVEALWLGILGLGFIIESSPVELFKTIRTRFEERNFTSMTTLVVGILAMIAGVLSLPQINIQNPAFLAVKGVMSIIAVIFIMIQTWVIK